MNVTVIGDQSTLAVIWIGTGLIAIADRIALYDLGWIGVLSAAAFATLTLAAIVVVLNEVFGQ
jgi:hypothetical protein